MGLDVEGGNIVYKLLIIGDLADVIQRRSF